MRRAILAFAALAAAPAIAPAQVGTMEWMMRIDIPDSATGRTGGLSEIEMRMIYAHNGEAWAMQLQPAQSMVAAFPMMDLSGVRLVAVVPVSGDSFHVGVVMPPDIAAQMGGGMGFRVDGAIPDSIPLPASFDSLLAAEQSAQAEFKPQWKDTGRRATVGGQGCEEWTMSIDPRDYPMADSTDLEPIDIQMCLAEESGLMKAWTEWLKNRIPGLMANYEQLRLEGMAQFGGRTLVPIRMEMTAPLAMRFELISQSNTAPDASFFRLPEGLEPFPMEMFRGMMPTGN